MAKTALRNSNTRPPARNCANGARLPRPARHRPAARRLRTEEDLLVAVASLVCLARSPVKRDPYRREIVNVHSPEGPARIAKQLHKLLVALEAMGVTEPRRRHRAGLDSIPSPRRDVLVHLLHHGEQATSEVAVTLHLPRLSADRALEELVVHRVAFTPEGPTQTTRPTSGNRPHVRRPGGRRSAGTTPEASRHEPSRVSGMS